MTRQTFEDFLEDKHGENYQGIDDDMSDNFDRWLCDLDVQDLLDYGEEYGERMFSRGCKEAIKQLDK